MPKPIDPQEAEERIIDTLIGWKKNVDHLATHTAAARAAITEAKELKVWEGKYDTFKEWLAGECEITEQWAYTLIDSARTITLVEEAATTTKALAPLASPDNIEILRGLPDRAVRRLKSVTPVKAAKAALRAIAKADGVPTEKDVIAELDKVTEKKKPEPVKLDRNHPVLIALDNEWTAVRRDLSMHEFTPKQLFDRFRKAVAGAL